MADQKTWSARIFIGLIFYFITLTLLISYGGEVAEYFGESLQGSSSGEVDLATTFGDQSSCNYPRYKYNTNGEASRYIFNLDNLDCEISAGAISEKTCNFIEGCTWNNVTTNWIFFKSTEGVCEGTIDKTFYNNNVTTNENICEIDGLQGDNNTNSCGVLGCTVYAPRTDAKGGVSSPLVLLDTVGGLFSFRYDFGFETQLYANLTTIIIFYLPFLLLLISLYLLSPLSN